MTWTSEWPTEPGHYWFYGWTSAFLKKLGTPPEIHLVKVIETSTGPAYTTPSIYLYQDMHRGKWLPAVLPEPPDNI